MPTSLVAQGCSERVLASCSYGTLATALYAVARYSDI